MRLTLEQAQSKLLEAFKKLSPEQKKQLIDAVEQQLDVQNPVDKQSAQ